MTTETGRVLAPGWSYGIRINSRVVTRQDWYRGPDRKIVTCPTFAQAQQILREIGLVDTTDVTAPFSGYVAMVSPEAR